jgi:hypothetical protein
MITTRCRTNETALISQMAPFQGALKKRMPRDVAALMDSIRDCGLLQPFALWNGNLLDGHGRLEALKRLAETDPEIHTQEFPVVKVEADSYDEARSMILEMNAKYGRITPKGLSEFVSQSPKVKIPPTLGVKTQKPPQAAQAKVTARKTVTLSVEPQYYDALVGILKGLSYVSVLRS